MKIHLPKGLRQVLLASLAAVAVPATLSTTVGTASGIAAACVALSALTAQQTAAEYPEADAVVTDSGSWGTFVDDTVNQNTSGKTVAIQEASQGSIYFGNRNEIINANVRFDTDLSITSGFSNAPSGHTYTFNGAFTGVGSFKLVRTISNQHYIFTGDLSQWGGNIEITGGAGNDSVEFSGGDFKSSTGTITVTAGNNSTLIVDGVELKNSAITASLLEVRGDVSFTGQSVTVTGATTIGENTNLTLGQGTLMHVGSLAEGSTLTSLTLGAGSEFALDAGSLNIGTLTLSGQDVSLAMTLAADTHLTLSNFVDNGNTLTIHLDALEDSMVGYALFGDSWQADWAGKIVIDGDINGKRVELDAQGHIVVLTDEILVHDEDGLNAIIDSDNQAGKEWYIDIDPSEDNVGNGVYFNPGTISANVNLLQTLKINNGSSNGTVTFSGVLRSEAGANFEYAWSGGTNVTYAFTGDLTEFHGDMVVTEAGNEVTFSFGTTTGDGAITNESSTGEGKLKVALNGTTVNATVHANDLSVAGNVTLNKNVTITGTSDLGASTGLTLGSNVQVNLGAVTGSLTSLTLAEGSSLSVGSGTLTAGTLTVNGDATLGVGNGSLLSFGSIDGEGMLTIDISGLGDFITYQLLDPSNMSWYETWKDKLQFIGKEGVTLNEHGMLVTGDFNTDYGTPTPAGPTQDVSGSAWYTGVGGEASFTVQGGASSDAPSGNLKLSNTYSGGGEASPTLHITGAVESLYFTADPGATKGAFQFGSADKWVMAEGATIKDIYIDNAELYLQFAADLGGANVHVSGLTDSNPWEGTLRVKNATVEIGGDLIVEGDALISVQGGGKAVVDGYLTGTGELMIGTHNGGTLTLKQGGELNGQLTFRTVDAGAASAKLELEKATDAETTTTLTVYGLSSSTQSDTNPGGTIVAGGTGAGTATLTLNGTGNYTYKGTIGTDTAPTDATTGWTDTSSSLNLVINLVGGGEEMGIAAGGATGTQTILGNVHVNDLTVSGGTLIVPDGTSITVQVDGNMLISGTGKFAFGDEKSNCPSHLIVRGVLTIDNLDDSSREAFFTQGGSTTLIKGQFRANGSIGTYGNITFEQGGELSGTLRYGWSGGITLGGDLTVGGLERGVEDGTHINKLESTGGTVYLLRGFTDATEATFENFYNNLKSWGTIGDGIGFGKAGEGKLTLTGGGTVGYDFKVAGGELSLGEGTWTFQKGLTGGVGETKSTLSIGGGISIGGSLTGNLDITSTATSGDETADWEQRNVWVDMNGSGESTLDGTVTFGEGVGLKKSGTGKLTVDAGTLTDNTFGADIWVTGGLLTFTGSSLTLNGDIRVDNGAIKTDGNQDALTTGLDFSGVDNVVVNGELTVTGDIVFYGTKSRQLTLKKGGTVTGKFLASWGPTITLGADLEVGGFAGGTQSNNPVRSFTRYTGDDATVPEIVYILLNNSGDVSETSDAFCNSIKGGGTIGDGVGIGKTGTGTLNFTDGGTISQDFKVAGGTLALDANAYTFSKSLTVTGEGSALTAGAGLTVTGIFTVTDGATANVTGQLLTGGNGEEHVTIETLVSAGGQLTVGSYLTARNTLVTGKGSSMTINGDAALNNRANLTVDDGASVTIKGVLKGNKTGGGNGGSFAGDIYVGSYDSANQTTKSGTLTLGEESESNTHTVNGLKVYGTGSTLTVNGNLTTYGYDGVTQGTIAGLEIMYGATATVSGNLVCGNGNDVHSALVLGGEGNTGTLTVTGTLSAGDVTVEGEGSALTVKGATATLETLAVNGGNVTVTGMLGLRDGLQGNAYETELSITGGGSVTADFLRGKDGTGHAGCLTVGAETSSGTLTLNGENKPGDGKSLKAKSLKVQSGTAEAAAESPGAEQMGSVVNIQGDVELYRSTTGNDGDIALEITGNSSVSIEGSLFGQDGGNMKGIHITDGGSLTVSGNVKMENSAFDIEDGTATVGSVIAGDVTVEGGGSALTVTGEATLGTLAGNGSVSGGNITVKGSTDADGEEVFSGTLEKDTKVTLSEGGHWTLGGGFSGAGATVVVGGTLNVNNVQAPSEDSGTANLGTVEITSTGTLEVGAESNMKVGTMKLADGTSGGAVTVTDGSALTVGNVSGTGQLTSLTLGSGANLTINSGDLAVAGTLTWGSGAKLTLGDSSEQKLTWSADCFTSETKDGALTVHLSDEYLNGLEFGQDSFLNLDELTWSSDWSDQFTFETDEASNYKNVHLDENGHLVWESNGVEWSKPEGGKWSELGNWKEAGAEPPAVKVEGRNVFFYALGDATGETSIEIDGEVAPINVYVKSGNYAFTGGGLNITGEGVLSVGGDEEQMAWLTLRNTNTSIPTIELQTNGTLVLDSDGALTSTDSGATKLQFLGGTLEIGEGLTNTDVSNYVDAEGSTAAVKINVGSKDVTWGSAETGVSGNGGLTLILDEKGLEKTGTGNFTLAWKETEETERRGALKVAEGTLTLDVTAEVGASLTGGATVEQGAILDLKASGAGLNMGSVSGAGTLKVSQGEVTLSGNNTVSAIELAGGNTTLGSDTALGGADTVLTLSGGGIASGSASAVNAGTVRVTDGKETTVSGTVTFSGEIGGGGTLRAGGGATLTLSGSVSGFNGKLDTGDGTVVLRGEALSGDNTNHLIQTTVCGNGTIEFAGNATYGGTVEGGVTLKSTAGSELLVLSTQSSTGAKLEGSITLGNTGTQAQWNGAAVTGGTITLANVKLSAGGLSKQGEATIIVDTAMPAASDAQTVSAAPTGGVVDVSGMDAGNLDGIRVNANGQLKGVVGTYAVGSEKTLTLHFTTENSSETEGDPNARALVEGTDFTVELRAGNATDHGLQLGFDADMAAWFRTHDELYLHVLEGGTWETEGVTLDWTQMTDEVAQLMDIVVGGNYQFTADGLKLTGSTKDLYLVTGEETGDPGVSNTPADLKDKLATVVTNEQTLTLNWAEDGTVNNLFGTEGTALDIKNVTGSGITVTFDNTKHDPIRDDRYPDSESGKGQDTTFEGSITGSYGVDIVKVGTGTLTVGGDYTLKNGDTRIEAGALRLRGEKNTMESLTFAYGAAPGEGEQRGLLLENGQTTIGSIVEAADAETTEGNEVNLTHGAGLTLTGQSTLANTGITGDKSGTLELADGAGLSFTGAKGITDVAVNLEGERSTLDLGTTQSTLPSLNGKGTLRSSGVVNVSGGTFSGTLDGEGGTLAVTDGASFTLDNARSTAAPDGGGGGMNVRLGNGSRLTIDVSKKSGTSDDTLVLGDIDLGNGHVTVDYGDKSIAPHYVQGNIIDVGKDGIIEFHSTGPVADGKRVTGFSVEVAGSMKDFIDEHVKFTGLGNFMKDHSGDVDENGNLVITTTESKENKFDLAIPGAGKNAHAGAALLGDAFRKDAVAALLENPTSQYAQLIYALVSDIENGRTAGLPRTYASVAGAAISTLGPALAQDVHRQLLTIRNRTTMMSADAPSAVSDKLPYWHAWIQAEGGYHKMDADGTAPGFTLNNWGGTVGVDADISRATTMGLAVTAMYGDLKPDAADSATGDLDTVYLSAFARTMHGAWCHTFAVSAGMVDAKLDRTVSHSGGSYHTSGSTDGYAFGVLYEVGYTKLTGKNGTLALQPIANVELRHVTLDGYSETGSDAGLNVDDIEQTVLTFGAGARIQAAVSENAFNRTSVLEARLLAKADIGDRSGTATNAIIGHSKRAEVESAEVGAVGIETGIGISIPLGSHSGSIFADASLEWRDNWVSTNATLGYRINF